LVSSLSWGLGCIFTEILSIFSNRGNNKDSNMFSKALYIPYTEHLHLKNIHRFLCWNTIYLGYIQYLGKVSFNFDHFWKNHFLVQNLDFFTVTDLIFPSRVKNGLLIEKKRNISGPPAWPVFNWSRLNIRYCSIQWIKVTICNL